MTGEEDGEEHEGCNATRDIGGDGGSLNSQSWNAEMSEDKGVVTDDIDDIHKNNDEHRVDSLMVGTQRG